MADKKVISIRFHMDSREDMELYERLEQEAGTSDSLASVVKAKIRDFYNKQDDKEQNNDLQDRLVAVVREEMQESGMKLVGAILSGMVGGNGGTVISSSIEGHQRMMSTKYIRRLHMVVYKFSLNEEYSQKLEAMAKYKKR